jgi:hypothetical protein
MMRCSDQLAYAARKAIGSDEADVQHAVLL